MEFFVLHFPSFFLRRKHCCCSFHIPLTFTLGLSLGPAAEQAGSARELMFLEPPSPNYRLPHFLVGASEAYWGILCTILQNSEGLAPGAQSGTGLITHFIYFLPFSLSLIHSTTGISSAHLPNKLFMLESLIGVCFWGTTQTKTTFYIDFPHLTKIEYYVWV